MPNERIQLINFRQEKASNLLFPKPALLSSSNVTWTDIRFELHQQPEHGTAEHRNTMHILVSALCSFLSERWIEGRFQQEFRTSGDTCIIPAGTLHYCQWQQEAQFMFVALEPTFLAKVGQEIVNPDCIELIPHFATVRDSLICGVLQGLRQELESQSTWGSLYVDQLKTMLALHLLRKYSTCTPRIAAYSDGLPPYKLRQAIDYINDNLNRKLGLEAIANELGMSQYYFCRLFKQSMGIAPYRYLMQQRIERAKELLKQGVAIADIALECGFANQRHFSKAFRQFTGTTPKKYQSNL
ncbi:helix-turn-helix domain-containing protein [Scytonema sp. PCC 10023]|uniref:helix-turn-helix domain-containing protein n=1 Tax=Scytonema sp. PCC 10023 TaxID=1680591 RepID=UPI0039C6473F